MALINLLGANTSGKSLHATAQERTNLYYEQLPQQDKSAMVAYGWPGSTIRYKNVRTASGSPVAGEVVKGCYYSSSKESLFIVTSVPGISSKLIIYRYADGYADGYYDVKEAYFGDDHDYPVFAENPYAAGELLWINPADIGSLYRYSNASGLVELIDGTPAGNGLTGLCYLSSRFVVSTGISGQGKFFWSNLNDGSSATGWNALNYATTESSGDPTTGCWSYRGTLVLFGRTSIEFWNPSPDLNLPFSRSYSITSLGIPTIRTVAEADNRLFFVGAPSEGGIGVYALSGYDYVKISTTDIDLALKTANGFLPSDKEFSAYTTRVGGKTFYVLRYQTTTFAFDIASGIWSKLKTGSDGYLFNRMAPAFIKMADSTYQYVNIATSNTRNSICYLDDSVYTDTVTSQLDLTQTETFTTAKSLVSPHVFDGGSLNKLVLSRVRLDMENSGTGTPTNVNLSISRDGGKTYGNVMNQQVYLASDGLLRAEWRRLGIARDYVFKFEFPDAAKTVIIGAYVETKLANR